MSGRVQVAEGGEDSGELVGTGPGGDIGRQFAVIGGETNMVALVVG